MKHCDRCISKEGCETNNYCYFEQSQGKEETLAGKSVTELTKMLIENTDKEEFELCAVIKRVIDKKVKKP